MGKLVRKGGAFPQSGGAEPNKYSPWATMTAPASRAFGRVS